MSGPCGCSVQLLNPRSTFPAAADEESSEETDGEEDEEEQEEGGEAEPTAGAGAEQPPRQPSPDAAAMPPPPPRPPAVEQQAQQAGLGEEPFGDLSAFGAELGTLEDPIARRTRWVPSWEGGEAGGMRRSLNKVRAACGGSPAPVADLQGGRERAAARIPSTSPAVPPAGLIC